MTNIGSRTLLDNELQTMSEDILRMGSLLEEAIDKAVQALATQDIALANEVIAGDADINRLRFQIEEKAQLTLATQQPMARDLRQVIAALHIGTELERIGDHAAGIGRLATRLEGVPQDGVDWTRLPKMAKRAHKMLHKAIEAYAEQDTEAAWKIVRRDQKLDRHYREFFGEALTMMNTPEQVQLATYLLWVAHNLERIGDRTTNIAERVIFMVTGQYTEVLEDYA
jgi:phosphate transport system protein